MDTTLATVTIISLGLAWAMAIVTWQRVRAERRRSEDRVAGLMAELAVASPSGAGSRGPAARRRDPATRSAAAVARGGEVDGDLDVDIADTAAFVREIETEGLDAGFREPAATADASSPRCAPTAMRLPFAASDRSRRGGDAVARAIADSGKRAGTLRRGNGADSRRIGWTPGRAEGDGDRAGAPPADDGVPRRPAPGAGSLRRGNGAAPGRTGTPRGGDRRGPVPIPSAPTHWRRGSAAVVVATIVVAGLYLAEPTPLRLVGVDLAERMPLSGIGAYLAERMPLSGIGAYLAERTPLPGAGAELPVELLSLRHLRQGDYLAVSGSLRNPPEGRERSKLSIAATVFDRSGAIIGTGQTPFPAAVLPPGGETAFTISLPSADRIERYRVSFMEDQSRLPHVDRRRPEAGTQARP